MAVSPLRSPARQASPKYLLGLLIRFLEAASVSLRIKNTICFSKQPLLTQFIIFYASLKAAGILVVINLAQSRLIDSTVEYFFSLYRFSSCRWNKFQFKFFFKTFLPITLQLIKNDWFTCITSITALGFLLLKRFNMMRVGLSILFLIGDLQREK